MQQTTSAFIPHTPHIAVEASKQLRVDRTPHCQDQQGYSMGTTSSKSGSSSARFAPASQPSGFRAIADNFERLEQVQSALRDNGLESSNLIVGIDMTKSNEWSGKHSFRGRSLHWLGHEPNPYEQVITIIAKTLAAFDDDGLIPCYGFGDTTTADQAVFSFFPGDQPARSLDALVMRYKELVPYVKLAGPTSFAPAIYQAMKIVQDSGNQYHILLLIADGQVTRSSDMPRSQASNQEQATINAIVEASKLPLSIVMCGVGDGPWDKMREFDDMIPQRRWDNFQFVEFTQLAVRYGSDPQRLETQFATQALMEIPEQFKIIQRMNLLGANTSLPPRVRCLNPPGPPPMAAAPPAYVPYGSFGAGAPAPYPGQPYGPPQGYAPAMPPPQYQPSGSFHQPPQYPPQYPAYQAPPSYPEKSAAPPADRPSSSSARGASSCQPDAEPIFLCPITHEVMQDPVVAADGHTYDRESIDQWLKSHDTSPMTGAKLSHKNLTPNLALRSSIKERGF